MFNLEGPKIEISFICLMDCPYDERRGAESCGLTPLLQPDKGSDGLRNFSDHIIMFHLLCEGDFDDFPTM